MKVLLDECVDRRLAREIMGHDVRTVVQMGWGGIVNGELLQLAAQRFDALVTVDRNLSFQQALPKYEIAVIVMRAPTNRLVDLRPIIPSLLAALPTAKPGVVTWIGSSVSA